MPAVIEAAKGHLRRLEGLRLVPYRDEGGKWTCGYGRLVGRGRPSISEATAEAWLHEDATDAAGVVAGAVRVPLADDQRVALILLEFNIGAKAFRESTLVRKLNAGDMVGAAAEFGRWVHVGGPVGSPTRRVVPGLVQRREFEEKLFRRGME